MNAAELLRQVSREARAIDARCPVTVRLPDGSEHEIAAVEAEPDARDYQERVIIVCGEPRGGVSG